MAYKKKPVYYSIVYLSLIIGTLLITGGILGWIFKYFYYGNQPEQIPAWFQAVGSIGAIIFALLVSIYQNVINYERNLKLKQIEQEEEINKIKTLYKISFDSFNDFLYNIDNRKIDSITTSFINLIQYMQELKKIEYSKYPTAASIWAAKNYISKMQIYIDEIRVITNKYIRPGIGRDEAEIGMGLAVAYRVEHVIKTGGTLIDIEHIECRSIEISFEALITSLENFDLTLNSIQNSITIKLKKQEIECSTH